MEINLEDIPKNKLEAAMIPSQKSDADEKTVVTPAIAPTALNVEDTPVIPKEVIQTMNETEVTVDTPKITQDSINKTLESIDNFEEQSAATVTENIIDTPQEDTEVYSTLAVFLKEKGILNSEQEIKDEESFISAFNKSVQNSRYSDLSTQQLQYLHAIEAGIPNETAIELATNMEKINKVTPEMLDENTVLAETLITEDFQNQGWDEERINKQIERLKTTGELTSEGLLAKNNIIAANIKAVETKRLAVIQAEEEEAKAEENELIRLKESIFAETKALGAVKVDDSLKNRVYESMTKPIAYDKDGRPLNSLMNARNEDPVTFEKNMYYVYELTNGFKDLSKLQRRAESTAAKNLRNAVSGSGIGLTGGGQSAHDTFENPDIPDIVNV